jgi:putative sterol carrier protein
MSTVEDVLADFVKRFRPEAAGNLRAVYQLRLAGEDGGTWHLMIADQECKLASGPAARPDVSFTMTTEDWKEIVAGKLDGMAAFFQGRIQVQGNLSLAAELQNLFG